MRYLLLPLLFALASPVFASEDLVPKKLIFSDMSVADGTSFAVKTTNKKHTYFMYSDGERCIATVKAKKISLTCTDNTTATISQDGTDVVMELEGRTMAMVEGQLMHGMYWSIMNAEQKAKEKGRE